MTTDRAGNQQLRTRKDLLNAAAQLIKAGKDLSIEEVAKEALVSRATAYRYFSDVDQLLTEVVIDESVPDPKEIFRDADQSNVIDRVDYAESVLHDFIYKNEKQLRMLLARSLTRQKGKGAAAKMPVRQNRRTEYIKESLAPYRDEFDGRTFKKLSEALALVFGPEAMIVFRDVVPLEAQRAREVKSWVLKTLVNAALQESRTGKKK